MVVSEMYDNLYFQCKKSKLTTTLRACTSAQNGPPGLVLTFLERSCHALCDDGKIEELTPNMAIENGWHPRGKCMTIIMHFLAECQPFLRAIFN